MIPPWRRVTLSYPWRFFWWGKATEKVYASQLKVGDRIAFSYDFPADRRVTDVELLVFVDITDDKTLDCRVKTEIDSVPHIYPIDRGFYTSRRRAWRIRMRKDIYQEYWKDHEIVSEEDEQEAT